MSNSSRVLLGLLLGAALGLLLAKFDPVAASTVASVAQPIGRLWLNALQMTIVPLVVSLLVIGVTTASDAMASGRIARDAMLWFVALLSVASFTAALVAPLVLSWLPRDPALIESLRNAVAVPAVGASASSLSDWFSGIVPTNAVAAAAQGAIVPLVVFTLFFAFALTRLEKQRRTPIVELFQTVADAMGVIVGWILWAAPVGVFALILPVCARAGVGILSALGYYIALLCALYLAMTALMYLVVAAAGKEPVRRFATAVLPAQVVAASTQSSLASLPAMVDSARNKLGYPTSVTSLVLPMAVSLFRITSPIQYMGVAAFVAWTYGIDLPVAQIALGAALAVVISIGSVGLPGQATFMGTNLPVVQAMGLPVEPLGLLMAVDLIPDIFATLGNVTADLTVTSLVVSRQPATAPDKPGDTTNPSNEPA
jgi:Na+/H+-dicarboxylate symporter